MGYKRGFDRKVRRVLRNEIETKRVVQTKQHCKQFSNTQGRRQLSGNGVNGPANTAGAETDYCWYIGHNQFQVWPVALLYSERGLGAGYEVQTTENPDTSTAYSNQFKIRVGSEIWCKGISLKMMWTLAQQVPYANLDIMLVRSKKGDCPSDDSAPGTFNSTNNDSNFYMGYSQNKELDMVNTRRHKILKTWKRKFYQFQPSTIGLTENAKGIQVAKHGTAALPESSKIVVTSATALTPAQWEAKIVSEYPDYYLMARGDADSGSQNYFSHLGVNFERDTLLAKFSERDLNDSAVTPQQEYSILRELSNTSTSQAANSDIENFYYHVYYSGNASSSYPSTSWSATTTNTASQAILVQRQAVAANVGAGPTVDQVTMLHQKLVDLWIPGALFGRGGNITYDAKGSTDELAGDYEYNLLFKTYANTKTWKWHGTGSQEPLMLALSDFQQIMYCKDL